MRWFRSAFWATAGESDTSFRPNGPRFPASLRCASALRPPQVLLAGTPDWIVQPAQVGRGDDAVIDQDPDRHLVREPHVGRCQPAVGDLAPQHLDVLGYPGRQHVAELR